MTFVLGLTGSIGMGKSATARLFRARGVPVYDADACVHALYAPGGAAVAPVVEVFPGVLDPRGAIDRPALGRNVLGDAAGLTRLEAIVHPLVRAAEERFLGAHTGHPLVVLDVPLLFETEAEARCGAVLVVTAPAEVQRARVLARPGMSEAAFAAIQAKQTPDAEKRRRAHFLVDTGRGFPAADHQVGGCLRALAARPATRR